MSGGRERLAGHSFFLSNVFTFIHAAVNLLALIRPQWLDLDMLPSLIQYDLFHIKITNNAT